MRARRLQLGELQTNCWLADDGAGGPTVVIDPAGDADLLLEAIEGEDVAWVVLTHGHFDHIGAADEVRDATGAPLAVHEADAHAITDAVGAGGALFGFDHTTRAAERLLDDGDMVEAGALRLRVLHTPGHTPGSICLLAEGEDHLFSGDTLFAGSVGRTDFPGGDGRALSRSLALLAGVSPDTLVHCGHGPDTTIEREVRVNPFFPRA
ncbi:MAG: MBL fold metallo-hydrolase [Actinobacteria bacterium]|nr:MAG: MBL fold metallo-hydrolase [Actinomycetota bacterium]